jgi:hypothetical protein
MMTEKFLYLVDRGKASKINTPATFDGIETLLVIAEDSDAALEMSYLYDEGILGIENTVWNGLTVSAVFIDRENGK